MINTLISIGIALLVSWLLLVGWLLLIRPKGNLLREALRLLPDVLRLLRRLAADRALPWGARIRLWLLFGYLALPIDLIPDFLPVIGYVDDAIIVIFVLRWVVRRTGSETIVRHWPGSKDGLKALGKLAGLRLTSYSADEPGKERSSADDHR